MACLQGGRPDQAQLHLQQLVAAYPGEAIYTERLATLLERRGFVDEAEACFRRLLATHPGLNNSRYNLARLLKRHGRHEQALEEYQQCLARNIARPEEVHNNISVIHTARHRHEQALAALRAALAHNPEYIPALYNLAQLLEEQGEWEEAKVLFSRILQREPGHAGALAHIANGETVVDPVAPVVRQIKRALRREGLAATDREELLYALGKAHDDCRQYDRAFDYYRQANQLSRERAGGYSRERQAQLVDQLVEHCDHHWLQSIRPVSDQPLVFICGMFRSGSTLLEQILAGHSALASGGEIDFFQRELAPFPRALLSLESADLTASGHRYLDHLAEAFPRGARVINKRPDNFYCIGLLRGLYPNARFLISTREPLDNCLSLYFQPMEAGQAQANDLLDAGHYYLQYRRLVRHWQQLAEGALLEVSYERLVTDMRQVVGEVLAFLQLDWQEQCLDFQRTDNRVRTASAAQVRQPLYQRSRGRWQHYQRHLRPLRDYLQDALAPLPDS
ncbi:MAG: sulfotransferase [Pseudomonadales bacterium]|nr:sulfotransferase [Halieaceae bacterium]MCP5165692.1 sulfotransferase [Pseudomonadales bacterium]MCP5190127.1 sulfotransferase [Pseudomonadales bacterium]MCP5204190.1 sulfotransferase [Pseudomonadales bacterium]